MHDVGVNLRPDFFRLCQYLWGTFPFSLKLPEGPNTHPLYTVNISAACLVVVPIRLVSDQGYMLRELLSYFVHLWLNDYLAIHGS